MASLDSPQVDGMGPPPLLCSLEFTLDIFPWVPVGKGSSRKKVYDDFIFGDELGQGSYSVVRLPLPLFFHLVDFGFSFLLEPFCGFREQPGVLGH